MDVAADKSTERTAGSGGSRCQLAPISFVKQKVRSFAEWG